ncbi:Ribosomal protein L7/L12 C-terminal [Arabidopsis thaliana x Arabidopsis arenosa]|uniref:Ribosomal protein L7/L12 C-terminal n=1 Tax=Arabidopsis thaliana x Arabidopsis arenosa TaxID=1240361 RepID=A0A8T1ZHD6_9BRAS|nr:Ribosomal protein L7/L12 C-terminal [Arabidopsis thaliana x Arabidopsis arenosa]
MRVLRDGQSGGGANEGAKAEKTVFEVKLESFEACAKIKIITEDAKELVEKAPTVVKTGVSKEEGEEIVAKLKALGAKAVLVLSVTLCEFPCLFWYSLFHLAY